MIILGIDTELTDLGENAEIIEFGGVLYDTEHSVVLSSYGQIYNTKEESAEGAAKCHGIPRNVSVKCGFVEEALNPWHILNGDMADYIVAHNAMCDHPIVTKTWKEFLGKPWLCTQNDLDHSKFVDNVSSKRLGHLCVDYKINSGVLHRAQEDAKMCAIIASMHNLDEAYRIKLLPRFKLICFGDFIKGVDVNAELKKAPSVEIDRKFYKWNSEKYPKCWVKGNLLEEDLKKDFIYIKKLTKGRWEFNLEKMDPKPY